jgi:hypothetical protein
MLFHEMCFSFGNAQSNQRASDATKRATQNRSSYAGCYRPCGDQRANAWNGEQSYVRQDAAQSAQRKTKLRPSQAARIYGFVDFIFLAIEREGR